MSCDRFEERLSAHLDRELPSDGAREVDDHVGSCSACAARLESLRRLDALCLSIHAVARAADAPLVAPAEWRARWDAVANRRAGGAGSVLPLGPRAFAGIAAALAVAAALLVAGSVFFSRLAGPGSGGDGGGGGGAGLAQQPAAVAPAPAAPGAAGGTPAASPSPSLATRPAPDVEVTPIADSWAWSVVSNACCVEYVRTGAGWIPTVVYPASDDEAVVIWLNRDI